jgi:uncharacterized protein (TIGR00369 family)
MSDTETLEVELPADVADKFRDIADAEDTDTAGLTAQLIRDRVDLARSISAYGDRDGDSAMVTEGPEYLFEVGPPVAELVGFDLVEMEPGHAVMSFSAGPEHANPMGTLHGGILCDVADAAMGTAFASTLDPGESFTTLELDVKFLKPVWDADLTATAEIVKRGRKTGLVECRIHDEADSLVAKLESVCMVLRDDDAAGR